jgi:hypothetical protein
VGFYLEAQDRFRHLYKPTKNEEAIAKIQRGVVDYWTKASKQERFEINLSE